MGLRCSRPANLTGGSSAAGKKSPHSVSMRSSTGVPELSPYCSSSAVFSVRKRRERREGFSGDRGGVGIG